MTKMKKCPICKKPIKIENLERHLKKVHPNEKIDIKFNKKEKEMLKKHDERQKELEKPIGLWKIAAVIFFIAVALAAVTFLYPTSQTGSGFLPISTEMDDLDFTVTDTDGNQITLSNWKGNVIYVDLIQSTCGYCKLDTQETLVRIYKDYGSQIKMISISILDTDTDQDLIDFRTDTGATWPFALDTANIQHLYGLDKEGTGTPTGFLFDKSGTLVYQHQGLTNYETLAAEINKNL